MSASSTLTFRERLHAVEERVRAACARSGRRREELCVIAVSKTHPAEVVLEALAAGVRDFGENRVQEGVAKAATITSASPLQPVWHLIGHLQTNKVRAAVGTFAILHAVDSERLLRAISGAAPSPVQVMIEVNVSGEATKEGIRPDGISALLDCASSLPNVRVRGLMTVAPLVPNAELTRPVFRELRRLADSHNLAGCSMGMTNDYEVAIEEGATHIRIGRALFGERA